MAEVLREAAACCVAAERVAAAPREEASLEAPRPRTAPGAAAASSQGIGGMRWRACCWLCSRAEDVGPRSGRGPAGRRRAGLGGRPSPPLSATASIMRWRVLAPSDASCIPFRVSRRWRRARAIRSKGCRLSPQWRRLWAARTRTGNAREQDCYKQAAAVARAPGRSWSRAHKPIRLQKTRPGFSRQQLV